MGALKVRTGPSTWATVVGVPGAQGPPGPPGPAGPGPEWPFILVEPSGDVEGVDDTTAIQVAIDSSNATGGGTVQLMPGSYYVTKLVMRPYVWLRGCGRQSYGVSGAPTVINQVGGVSDDLFRLEASAAFGGSYNFAGPFAMSDMILVADSSATTGNGIHFLSADGSQKMRMQDASTLRNLVIRRFPNHGIKMYGVGPGYLSDIECIFNGGDGINIEDLRDEPGATGNIHHASLTNISGDGNIGGATIRIKGARDMAGVVLTGIKTEYRLNTDRGSAMGNTNCVILESCENSVTINGLTHMATSSVTDFQGPAVLISGTRRPRLSWSGMALRTLPAQVTGTKPALVYDAISSETVAEQDQSSGSYNTRPRTDTPTGWTTMATSANTVTCPGNAAFVSAEFDIQLDVKMASWKPTATTILCGCSTSAAGIAGSFMFQLLTTGAIQFSFNTGGAFTNVNSPVFSLLDATRYQLRITRDPATGLLSFFYRLPGGSWTANGTASTPVTTAGTGAGVGFGIGCRDGAGSAVSSPPMATFYGFSYATKVDGNPIAKVDLTAPFKRYLDLGANQWTVNGSGSWSTPSLVGEVDVRSFGAVPDFDLATQTVVTNSTVAFQAAIDAVRPGGTIYVPACSPGKAFAVGVLTIKNPIMIRGDNRYSSRIVALPTMTAGQYVLNVQVGTLGVDVREESHGFGFHMRDLYLDGARRVPDVGAIKFSQNDRNIIERCQIRNFARQALYLAFSVRESEFRSVYIRWCGNPGFAAIDLTDTAGADQHNNIHFSGCKVLYSYGEALRVASAQQSVRLIEFDGCMFHNMTTAMLDSGVGFADADNWTPTLTGRELETPLIHLVDARGVNFRGCRFHMGGYGQPLVMQRDGSVAGPKSSRFISCSLGDVATRQLTGVSVASNVFTSNNHRLGTAALVRVTGSSLANTTDYYVIRVSANTFSLAATLAAALAGTPVVTVTNASGITIDAQTRQFDLSGTNSYMGVSGSDATNASSIRACIIDWVNNATRVWLTDTFFLATTGIE